MKVVIIFNPNSTGDSQANAKKLAGQLKAYGVPVTTRKTSHAGHGEEIAEQYAKSNEQIVLISSSGDGGYHEVINGALKNGPGKLIVGVLPSGNANDHHSALGGDDLAKAIKNKHFKTIDTIKVTAKVKGDPWVRYAHSLFSFKYTKLRVNNDTQRFSSILFGNIDRMSKVIGLSANPSVTDGKFEMSSIRFRSKLRLAGYLITAATVGLKQTKSLTQFAFKTVHPMPIQLDGEVLTIDKDSDVLVQSMKQNLRCVL